MGILESLLLASHQNNNKKINEISLMRRQTLTWCAVRAHFSSLHNFIFPSIMLLSHAGA